MTTNKKTKTCNRCGKGNLVWQQSKNGKWYLTDAEPTPIKGENGRTIKNLRLAHKCEEPQELDERDAQEAFASQRRSHYLSMGMDVVEASIRACHDAGIPTY
jgi:hypothetical protein